MHDIPRRQFLINGSVALTALALLEASRAYAFPSRPGESVVRWLDQPTENPDPVGIQTQLVWENLDSWITPNEEFFSISHFDRPVIDASTWKEVAVGGKDQYVVRIERSSTVKMCRCLFELAPEQVSVRPRPVTYAVVLSKPGGHAPML
jgi:DMSO/TMAO reductase YedYZ molybdopterin-dependent catalytic subunit